MSEPTVCAILLTADRPQMTKRAVECFLAQTYPYKKLLLWDTGTQTLATPWYEEEEYPNVSHVLDDNESKTIGALRNDAIAFWNAYPIIIHWDSDDYSHPNRIAEQLALLQASGADCVGYNEMLFWREARWAHYIPTLDPAAEGETLHVPGEAWLYSNPQPSYALGASLCYWRTTWEKKPFADTSSGEDLRFIDGLKVKAVSGIQCEQRTLSHDEFLRSTRATGELDPRNYPMMIARIHGGNTHCRITDQSHEPEHLRQWKRVPEWDARLRSIMESNSPRPAEGTASKPTPRQTP